MNTLAALLAIVALQDLPPEPVRLSDAEVAPATQARRVTLRECVQTALERNPSLETARCVPWSAIEAAAGAEGIHDPLLSLSTLHERRRWPAPSLLLGTSALGEDADTLSLSLRQYARYGATAELFATADRLQSNAPIYIPNPRWQNAAGLALTLPLLRGAGDAYSESTIRVADRSRRMAEHEFEARLAGLLLEIHAAYWDLALAHGALAVKRTSLDLARRLAEENRKRFEQELIAEVEVTEAEVAAARAEEEVLSAENDVADAEDLLRARIDPALLEPGHEGPRLETADEPAPPAAAWDGTRALAEAVAAAMAGRPELRATDEELARAEIERDRLHSDALPRVDLTGRASLRSLDDAWSSAWSEAFDHDFHDWALGVALEWPLGNRQREAAARRVGLEARRLGRLRADLETSIRLQARGAAREVGTVRRRIEVAARALALAEKEHQAELSRKEQGLRTTFHILEAQKGLEQARLSHLRAQVDHERALAALRRAEGRLLETFGVEVEKEMGRGR